MTNGFLRSIVSAAAGGVLLLTILGCPASGEKSDAAKPPSSAAEQPPAAESIAAAEPPVAEFRRPAALPPSEPLPKATTEPTERPALPLGPPKPASYAVTPASHEEATVKAADKGQPLPGRPNVAKNLGVPFDPIAKNDSIFKDWPKPKLAMIITGMEEGYIEPCGCAGLDRMTGGMSRRHTLFKQLRQDGPLLSWIEDKAEPRPAHPGQGGWPVVGLDVGGLVHGFGQQAVLKFRTLVDSKIKMGYDAVAFGTDDLRLPTGEVVAMAAAIDGKPGPFVSANVGLFGFDAGITAAYRLVEAGGLKIGVTTVLGKKYQKEIRNDEIVMIDPEAALQKILPELKKSKPDYLVLLAHATRDKSVALDESVALARKFPEFNIVVTSDGHPVPPKDPETVPGLKTLLITVGQKGMYAVVLGFMDDAQRTIRYQRVPLDSRFAASPDMKLLMTAYQEQLKDTGFAGLGLRPVPHPLKDENGRFVGSDKCLDCHEDSYKIWKKSLHAHAYDTLAKLDPPRNYDPECVSCHVTGWHPTEFFPYETGYQSKEKTPLLINTGCEDCHGPGEKHCSVELVGSEELKQRYRKAVRITKAESEKQQCMTCHDLDNSPDFDFKAYWPFVEHYEKEKE